MEYGESPEKEYAIKETIEKIKTAFESLPEIEAKVLELRFSEKMTLQEVADELKLSSKSRARQKQELGLRRIQSGKLLSEEAYNYLVNGLGK
ncbi:MAG: hypothetical protein IT410_04220 [Candidatus Doudnabacteria bacterium]|nr:hypothetical protein [Candidatus Doudnabacteria bacterium]